MTPLLGKLLLISAGVVVLSNASTDSPTTPIASSAEVVPFNTDYEKIDCLSGRAYVTPYLLDNIFGKDSCVKKCFDAVKGVPDTQKQVEAVEKIDDCKFDLVDLYYAQLATSCTKSSTNTMIFVFAKNALSGVHHTQIRRAVVEMKPKSGAFDGTWWNQEKGECAMRAFDLRYDWRTTDVDMAKCEPVSDKNKYYQSRGVLVQNNANSYMLDIAADLKTSLMQFEKRKNDNKYFEISATHKSPECIDMAAGAGVKTQDLATLAMETFAGKTTTPNNQKSGAAEMSLAGVAVATVLLLTV